MTDDSLAARVAAVERALTDGDTVADLSDAAETQRRLDRLTDDLADLTERVDALEATVQSLHGYVGEIEHVNERVERRADAARAAVERTDEQAPERTPDRPAPGAGRSERTGGVATAEAGDDRPGRMPAALDEHDYDGENGGGSGESLLDRLRSSL